MIERVWLRNWLDRAYELAAKSKGEIHPRVPQLLQEALYLLNFPEAAPVAEPATERKAS